MISEANGFLDPQALPWDSNDHPKRKPCRPAFGLDRRLSGIARWQELARLALSECLNEAMNPAQTPLVVASCNGSAARFDSDDWESSFDTAALLEKTPWRGKKVPVVSGSCASGLQALFLAGWLLENETNEVVVLAVDILSSVSYENFDALRILSAENEVPWQSASTGFLFGEAAVAVKLKKGGKPLQGIRVSGVSLATDIAAVDGFGRSLSSFSATAPQFIVAQGTGPHESNLLELEALRLHFDSTTSLTSPVYRFGHSLGVSSLLSIALAHLTYSFPAVGEFIKLPKSSAADGRMLFQGDINNEDIVVACRALSGQCGSARLSTHSDRFVLPSSELREPSVTELLVHPVLRDIAETAARVRPSTPPDILLVRLHSPLSPPSRAIIGNRILPSAILEITPGYIPRLIARCWGFTGPAICLVGNASTERETQRLINALRISGLSITAVSIHGTEDRRDIVWDII